VHGYVGDKNPYLLAVSCRFKSLYLQHSFIRCRNTRTRGETTCH